ADTACSHVLCLRPSVVEITGAIDRHLHEDVPRIDRIRQVGDLNAGPPRGAVDRFCNIQLPRTGTVEAEAARADTADKRHVDRVVWITGAHGFVGYYRASDPEMRIRWIRTRCRNVIRSRA